MSRLPLSFFSSESSSFSSVGLVEVEAEVMDVLGTDLSVLLNDHIVQEIRFPFFWHDDTPGCYETRGFQWSRHVGQFWDAFFAYHAEMQAL